jgi:rod shape-determining protein MreC
LAIVLSIVLGVGFLVLSRTQPQTAERLRGQVVDMLAPVLAVVSAPMQGAALLSNWVATYFDARDKAVQLQAELDRVQPALERSRALERENARLAGLLRLQQLGARPIVTARIIGASSNSYVNSAVLSAGTRSGVAPGQPVRDSSGILGRTLETGAISARVLLINDINSRVPVRNERTGQLGMIAGTHDAQVKLLFLPPGSDVKLGDRLVTSGHGGVFPPNIPAGVIAKLGIEPLVTPAARMDALDFAVVMAPYAPPAPPPPTLSAATLPGLVATQTAPAVPAADVTPTPELRP